MARDNRVQEREDAGVTSELLDGLVGYRLRRAMNRIFADFHATMADLQLRPVLFAMLAVIRENPAINQTTLGRVLGIQRANLVPLICELETRALIERQPVPTDRRAFALHLSPAGERTFVQARQRVIAHEERLLSDISIDQRQLLLDLLDRIRSE